MKYLFELELNELEIKDLIEISPNIKELDDLEIYNKIAILKSINCNDKQIRNIIISNPFYFDRDDEDILNLIKKLIEINITDINLLFDSNPYFLNKDSYEIDEYIDKEINKHKVLEDIVDELVTNPYIIDED